MFVDNEVAFGKMITETRTVFFQGVIKFFQCFLRADSVATVRMPLLNTEAIVKKFNQRNNGNSIHRHRKGVALVCTLMRENFLFLDEQI